MYFKTFFLLILLVCSVYGTVRAQAPTTTTTIEEQAAGYQLRLASKHFYTGLIIEGVGTVMYAIGAPSLQNPNGNSGLIILGSVGVLTGTVFMIESFSHIGKAGRILMGNAKFGLGPTKSGGLGISYNF
jgi:hypothetical protein